jgi:hypothetical protein
METVATGPASSDRSDAFFSPALVKLPFGAGGVASCHWAELTDPACYTGIFPCLGAIRFQRQHSIRAVRRSRAHLPFQLIFLPIT